MWTQEVDEAFEELKNAFATAPVLQQPDPGRLFVVECIWTTDHKNLEYLQATKRLTARQARWSIFFSWFQFKVTYRPDALLRQYTAEARSMNSEPVLSPTCFLASLEWELDRQIKAANPHPQCPTNLASVPLTQRGALITWAHASLGMGHPGISHTAQLIGARYWWSFMPKDVVRYVAYCPNCTCSKTPRVPLGGKLLRLLMLHRPWSHLAVDFVTDLLVSEGNTVILSVVDRFSKMVRFVPLVALPTTLEMADLLFRQVFRQFGLSKDIASDGGPQFTSRVWKELLGKLNITVSLTSGYHPRANGQVERVNQELGKFLCLYCNHHPET
ncbi:hypothetical protein P4O66_013619 [Electrophorus voltai]|uniref:Gypsy retrotransposon integrase-like protein 1 n=1 Tax=Electrophorus voltai TaxID=2609070 RepID=A0AAD8Z2Y1_9TELE|nr:hypothetical protein P4O66_013619 [Electrophorus voltai]